MAGILLLRGADSRGSDRRPLTDEEEQAVLDASRHLVPFTASRADAAIVHLTSGGGSAAWDEGGAVRLAQSLPPAFLELAGEIAERHGEVRPGCTAARR